MPRRRKNRTAIAVLLTSVILAVTLAAGGAAVYFTDGGFTFPAFLEAGEKSESSAPQEPESEPEESEAPPEEAEEEKPAPEPVKQPDELRAVLLSPGTDFLAGERTPEAVRAELDKAVDDAAALGMNAVVAEVRAGDATICEIEGMPPAVQGFDALEYLCQRAKAKGLFVYATFPVLYAEEGGVFAPVAHVDNAVLDEISARATVFAEKYRLTGVFLEDTALPKSGESMKAYQENSLGMGYQSYLYAMTSTAFDTAADAIRKASPGTLAGLYTVPVWASKADNPDGSDTVDTYSLLTDGNADARAWILERKTDFVAVQAFYATDDKSLAFSKVLSWWGELAKEAGIPLYSVHDAAKAAGTWTNDELAQQYLEGKNIPAWKGSTFSTLTALAANPKGSTDNLKRALKKEIDLSYILEKLELTKPAQGRTEVTEPTYTLTGASDPDYELLMNGEKVQRNEKGYFNITVTLTEGENTFRFQHKEQDLTYTIVLRSQLLKEITPTGQSPVTGGMSINITAMAYNGAEVYAMLNGQHIPMAPTEETGDEGDANGSSYIKYVGSYKTSVVTAERSLGKITVHASYKGATASKEGASVTVLPKVELGEGQLVQVIAPSAETFPDSTLDDTSVSTYFPICAGAMDYTVSDELSYTNAGKTYTYYQLASGRRVYAKDIDVVQDRSMDLNGNQVTGMSVSSGGGATQVKFQTQKQVSYTMQVKNGAVSIEFHYTTKVTAGTKVGENPLFSSASWNGSTVTLKLTTPSAFMGVTAEYSGGELIFRFQSSPGGVSGARIYIDVGHSADSPGADGNLGHWKEHDINLAISEELKSILEANGATVRMLDTASYVTLEQRLAKASAFRPHVFVSIHANSFTNPDSTGSEAYYFNSFSADLAKRISANMANKLGISNRGGKKGLYYVTRTQEFPAILAETGFITNYSDYEMLIDTDYQSEVAQGITSAINSYLAGSVGSYASSGEDYEEDASSDATENISSEEDMVSGREESGESSGGVKLESLTMEKNIELVVGDNAVLTATVLPEDADVALVWKSSSKKVVTVEEGVLTATGPGTATVTVSTKDGKYKATCKVAVTE